MKLPLGAPMTTRRVYVKEWRPDGWPLCPICGDDELMSSDLPAKAATVDRCLACGPLELENPNGPAPATCTRCKGVGRVQVPHPAWFISGGRPPPPTTSETCGACGGAGVEAGVSQ